MAKSMKLDDGKKAKKRQTSWKDSYSTEYPFIRQHTVRNYAMKMVKDDERAFCTYCAFLVTISQGLWIKAFGIVYN